MSDVFSRSLDGLKRADIVFVWLDDYEAHGSGVEIGYARGLGKPIFLTHAPHIAPKGELWFAFEAATQIKSFESAREAYAWFLQLVGQPSVSKD
jgi:nucleoside 2-deoxyribosyltransferase